MPPVVVDGESYAGSRGVSTNRLQLKVAEGGQAACTPLLHPMHLAVSMPETRE